MTTVGMIGFRWFWFWLAFRALALFSSYKPNSMATHLDVALLKLRMWLHPLPFTVREVCVCTCTCVVEGSLYTRDSQPLDEFGHLGILTRGGVHNLNIPDIGGGAKRTKRPRNRGQRQ